MQLWGSSSSDQIGTRALAVRTRVLATGPPGIPNLLNMSIWISVLILPLLRPPRGWTACCHHSALHIIRVLGLLGLCWVGWHGLSKVDHNVNCIVISILTIIVSIDGELSMHKSPVSGVL